MDVPRQARMIRKSGNRFSEEIMRKKSSGASLSGHSRQGDAATGISNILPG
jgi:hypothetical protein